MSAIPAPRCPGSAIPGPPQSAEVVVVGAGVTGTAVAWQLARRGHEVLLLERFGPGHDRTVGRDGTAYTVRQTHADPRLGRLAVEAYAGWRELERETGAELLTVTGGLDHGDPDTTAALAAGLTAQGVVHEWLEPTQAQRRWPGQEFVGRVLHQPDRAGRVRTEHAAAAFGAAAVGWGAVVLHPTAVEALEVRGPAAVDVRTTGGTVRARRVVVTAGPASASLVADRLAVPTPHAVPERAVRFTRRTAIPAGPVAVHHTANGPLSVAPLSDGRVEVGTAGPESLPSTGRLIDYAQRYLPGLDPGTAQTVERRATAASDTGFAAAAGPVAVGVGLSGRGLAFAPAAGRVLADLVTGTGDRVGAA
ncbi:FAD-dependent oxidoreductase [Pseudonocardia oroxyli]|uniref:Sarcosine oxidase n=1 Tax=Pseudonocardia oroxyli TaxID=366584 RepID=A0A1G8E8T7_PSEOR|nr:FAD-dependent oxidoreductase [Pseudonocardia oroxyli]SDH66346.1 sarcosine oxidase [Pseudonocardia oroxyli]